MMYFLETSVNYKRKIKSLTWRKKSFLEQSNTFSTALPIITQRKQIPISLNNNYLGNKVNIFSQTEKYANFNQISFNQIYSIICIQQFLSVTLETPVFYKNINIQNIIPQNLLNYMVYSMKSVRWKKFYIIHSNEIIEMLFLCLWFKNINLFMKWMKKYFERNDLKKHRKLFLFLKYLLGSFIWVHNIFFKLKGLKVALLGKFGKAGSVRKSRKYIKKGKCSYATKELAMINRTNFIRTKTGTFSIKLEIFFNKWCLH